MASGNISVLLENINEYIKKSSIKKLVRTQQIIMLYNTVTLEKIKKRGQVQKQIEDLLHIFLFL